MLLGILCFVVIILPVSFLLFAGALWLALKIIKEQREFGPICGAVAAFYGLNFVIQFPLKFMGTGLAVTGVSIVASGLAAAWVYSSMLEMDYLKGLLAWFLQTVLVVTPCCAIAVPVLFATGGMAAMAEAFSADAEEDLAMGDDEFDEDFGDEGAMPGAAGVPAAAGGPQPAQEAIPGMEGTPDSAMPGAMPGDVPMPMPGDVAMPSGLPGDPIEPMPGTTPMPGFDPSIPGSSNVPPGPPMPGAPGDPNVPPMPGTFIPAMPGDNAANPLNFNPLEPALPERVEPTFPAGLKGDAQRAFHQGRASEGTRLVQAALLTTDDPSMWKQVRWCSALNRPVTSVRWGFALQMSGKIPLPPPTVPNNQGGNEFGNPQPGGEAGVIPPQPGLPGAGIPQRGVALPGDALPGDMPPGNVPPGMENNGQANPLIVPPAVDGAPPELSQATGDIGPRILQALPESNLERLLGPWPEGSNIKGVQFIGTGDNLKEVMSLAEQKGVDVVVVAAVSFKVTGINRNIDASLAVRIMDVATQKRLWSSPTLHSNAVKAAMRRGQDPGGELVSDFTEYLEKNFRFQEKPAIDKEEARRRAEALAREEPMNPLPALMEIRYYQHHELLTPIQAELFYQRLIGFDDAEAMATGNGQQRTRIIERFVPISMSEPTEN